MNFLILTPSLRIALAFIVGLIAGWWGLLLLFLALLPQFKSHYIYLLIVAAGSILQMASSYNPSLVQNRPISCTMVVGERISSYHLCKVIEAGSASFVVNPRIVAEINEYTSHQLSIGDTIKAKVFVEQLEDFRVGEKSLLASLQRVGYNQIAYFYEDTPLLRSSSGRASKGRVEELANIVRQEISTRVDSLAISKADKGVVKAMVIGDKSQIMSSTSRRYISSGVAHILAISGFHIGVLFMLLNILFWRWDKIKALKVIKMVAILTTLWFFAILAALTPSVVRAVIMFSLFQVALYTTTSRFSGCNILAFTFVVMAALDTTIIYDVGFQLSFTAMGVIVGIAPLVMQFVENKGKKVKFLTTIIALSVLITLFTLPITLYHFGTGSLLSPITNFIFTIAAPIIYVLSMLAIATCYAPFSHLLATLFQIINDLLDFILSFKIGYLQDVNFTLVDLALSYIILALVLYAAVNYINDNRDENSPLRKEGF